jgi:hypothetical protein
VAEPPLSRGEVGGVDGAMDQRVAVHKEELPKSFRVVRRVVVGQHNAWAAGSNRREKLRPPHKHTRKYAFTRKCTRIYQDGCRNNRSAQAVVERGNGLT